MRNKRFNKGQALSELLIVVAIIIVLVGIAAVSVFAYLRSMTKLEYDNYAKEIFVAAQNHLSMSESQGYLGRMDFGEAEQEIAGIDGTGDGVYYFVITTDYTKVLSGTSVLNLMLPTGAVDETVRLGGSYIVRYHKDSARVLDVFYWKESDARFPHNYKNSDYPDFLMKRDDRSALRYYESDRSVIGWYGGADAASLTYGETLRAPSIVVTNADKLTVTVTDFNVNANAAKCVEGARLKLIITGVTSTNSREIILDTTEVSEFYSAADVSNDGDGWAVYNIVLDDISTPGKHFYDQFCGNGSNPLIPGEDVKIQAVAFNNDSLTNIAYSSEQTTNSLFAYNDSGDACAHISYMRHLENLDTTISAFACTDTRLDYISSAYAENKVSALQTTYLSWNSFPGEYIYAAGGTSPGSRLTAVANTYQPVTTTYVLEYDGDGNTVSDVAVDTTSYAGGAEKSAGLFGKLNGGSVSDLRLVDFTVSGTDAGALAGVATDCEITNVIALNSSPDATASVNGSAAVGGLIGVASAATVENSAAALVVSSTGANAGGLIGESANASVISGCFSGGHTVNGAYTDDFNVVSAGSAGGLVGSASNTAISDSYSTCSARGATAGGFAGVVTGGSISDSYCTGLVDAASAGAFAGTMNGATASNCTYFSIINEIEKPAGGYTYMTALSTGTNENVTPFDADAATYNAFVGDDRTGALAYDSKLIQYYQGKYALPTAAQLGATVGASDFVSIHAGDWPAPETWVVNTK